MGEEGLVAQADKMRQLEAEGRLLRQQVGVEHGGIFEQMAFYLAAPQPPRGHATTLQPTHRRR